MRGHHVSPRLHVPEAPAPITTVYPVVHSMNRLISFTFASAELSRLWRRCTVLLPLRLGAFGPSFLCSGSGSEVRALTCVRGASRGRRRSASRVGNGADAQGLSDEDDTCVDMLVCVWVFIIWIARTISSATEVNYSPLPMVPGVFKVSPGDVASNPS